MMPDMNGWQFRAAQKRDPSVADIPVVALAAEASDEAWALDAQALLIKPVDLAQLEAEVARALAGSAVIHRVSPVANLGLVAMGMTHELNNLLTYLMANLDEADQNVRSGAMDVRTLTEATSSARHAGARIAELVRDVQRTYRPGASDRRADVSAAVEAAARVAGHRIRGRVRLSVLLQDTPGAGISQAHLEQVLVNLILNAVHAMPSNDPQQGEITISSAMHDGRVWIEVRDTGSGIPLNVQQRVFEPFFTTRPSRQGSGIGLWISRSLVRASGGELSFESQPGVGTTFRLDLPAVGRATADRTSQRAKVLSDPLESEPERPRRAPRSTGGAGVLLVEPDNRVRLMMADVLEKEGYHVLPLATATEAVRLLQHVRPDLVLTSLRLGDMNGAEFLARLKADARFADVPSILVTGASRDEAEASLARAGVSTAVMEKPFPVARLLTAVRSMIAERPTSDTSAAMFG